MHFVHCRHRSSGFQTSDATLQKHVLCPVIDFHGANVGNLQFINQYCYDMLWFDIMRVLMCGILFQQRWCRSCRGLLGFTRCILLPVSCSVLLCCTPICCVQGLQGARCLFTRQVTRVQPELTAFYQGSRAFESRRGLSQPLVPKPRCKSRVEDCLNATGGIGYYDSQEFFGEAAEEQAQSW